MLQTNDITDLFKEFFRGFVHWAIFRIFLDNMSMEYVITKNYSYHPKIHGKLLFFALQGLSIQKMSV